MKHIHFIGIGGSGMSALAFIALQKGYKVSGSDIKKNNKIKKLRKKGVKVTIGHSRDNVVETIDKVVYSSAVDEKNPEINEAKNRNIKTEIRAKFLSWVFKNKEEIVVVGTHGKTTTTGMGASVLLEKEGKKASYYIGGTLQQTNKNGYYGSGNWAVLELDESDGSFMLFDKDIALINNIELEHVSYYKSKDALYKKFAKFVNCFKGKIYIQTRAYKKIKKYLDSDDKITTVGLNRGDFVPDSYDSNYFKRNNRRFELKITGKYNIFNSFLLYSALSDNGFEDEVLKRGLNKFRGVSRRQEIIYEDENLILIDDYGHHPTEIHKTFRALDNSYNRKYNYIIFQPHRFSRFKHFEKRFKKILRDINATVIVVPIYSASEKKDSSISAYDFFEELKKQRNDILYAENLESGYELLLSILQKDSLVITFGAGDVNDIIYKLKNRISKRKEKVYDEKT